MKDISIYLIHNNSRDRIDLRNKLKTISNDLNINPIEICKQQKNINIYLGLRDKLIILRIYLFRLYYDFKHKREFTSNFYYLLLKRLFKFNKYIFSLFFQNNEKNIKTFKHLKIESIVTRKHIKAWEHFLKSGKQIMIIFEDDAICKKDTERRLKDLLGLLNNIDLENFYIDLAGGFDLYDVIPKRSIDKESDDYLFLKGIFTNTACGYLINKNLTKLLYEEYKKSKFNNSFPIDHLINKLALSLNKSQNIFSIHFHNPLFTHGSFKGNIKSWQID